MALSLDGTATQSTSFHGGVTTGTVTLTTTNADDVIVVVIHTEKNGLLIPVSSVTDVAGLTWTKYTNQSVTDTSGPAPSAINNLEVWWAHAPSALSADVITVHLGNSSLDIGTITAFGVTGADTTTPFDTNVSLPGVHTNATSTSDRPSATISTTAANTMLLGFFGSAGSVNTSTDTTDSFIQISHIADAGGANFSQMTCEYKIVSAAQTSLAVAAQTTGTANDYVWIATAIKQAGVTISSTIDQTLSSITQAAANIVSVPDTIAQTLSSITQSLLASVAPIGTWGSTETKDTFAAAGHVPAPPPSFVNAGAVAHQVNGTSVTPALPGSRVNGNYLVAMVGVSANRTFTFPAGWTTIDSFNDGNVSAAYAYRVVDGTETDPAITWTTNTEAIAKVWQFSGAVFVGANLAKVGDPGNNATLTNPGLTTTSPNALVVLLGFGNNGSISGTPTSYTAFSNENPNGFALGAFGETVTTSGSASAAVSEGLSGLMRWISFEFELDSVIPPNFAAWASTESKDVWTSRGSLIGGSWHSTEPSDTMVNPFGTMGLIEAKDVFAGVGSPTPPLSVDARFTGGASGSSSVGVTSATVAVTTSFKDDIIVLGIQSGGFWHQGAVTSVSDTAGLFWQRRNQRQVIQNHLNGTTDSWVEEWWAHAPLAISTTITVNTAPTGAIAIEAVAVAGANTAAPFDTHTGAGLIIDNYSGNVIDPAGRGHFGNPAALLYTDSVHTLTLAFHASPDTVADTSVAPGFTFLGRSEHDEGSGNTLFMASMYKVENTQQFGTTDVWFGPDGTHITNRYVILDSIVGASESTSTNDLVRWYFDGTGQRTIVQVGTGQTSTAMNVVTFRENAIVGVAVMSLTGSNSRVDHISDDGNHSGWTRRSIVTDSSGAVCMEVWWVEMAEPFSGNITINMDAQIQNGDYISAVAFALHGADLFQRGEIWDGNGSLPATNHSTTGHQTVGPFDTSNDNVLVLAFGANIDTTTNDTDPTGKNVLPFLQLPAPGELVSSGPPSFNIALDYKFSGPVVSGATAEIDISPSAQSWLMIADAIAVGPVSPPHGTLAAHETADKTQHNGNFTAIGIASPGGWVGFPPNHAALAAVEAKDKTTNSGAFRAIWDINGWIGYVPAHMTMAVAEHDDAYHNGGWILGPRTILGRMHAGEDPDRLGFSNRGPAVTATMHPTEHKDNFSGNMLAIPTATPIPARKRRLLIVT